MSEEKKDEIITPEVIQETKIKTPKSPLVISTLIIAGALVAIGLIASAAVIVKHLTGSPIGSSSLNLPTHDGNASSTDTENSIANVAEKVSPSVVSIVTKTQTRSFYGTTSGEGAGTGIIVSKDGYIMTNNHVIENSNTVSIVDHKGTTYTSVKVVGSDPLNDVAFLKIQSDDTFTPAEIGNSATLRIGQQVVAIGNALGQYSNTVTSGIISGTGRPVTASGSNGQAESLTDLIQTDASINPGNSGGPLVNLSGQVIGINTAVAADANGIGFAIPVNATRGILQGVLTNGTVSRAYIGVNYLSITPEIAREYSLPTTRGAYVYGSRGSNPVAAGGPADTAGLKSGDIITKIDDAIIGQQGSLSSVIGLYKPGDSATVTYLRNGSETTTRITFSAYRQ
ncbi:trypsin-like peptidase domain-containing protein [Candidatus Saccharibacteria bacterium TM7i]|nr:trypsin-like peptidase domain-containing protein [Candidatus Saccharibacteria bacterium TM7i]